MYDKIPKEMRGYPNWVCFTAIPQVDGRISKLPVDPHTGKLAKSNDPSTWSDFDTAVRASGEFSGIGFMFSNSPYVGIDLDHVDEAIEQFKNDGVKDQDNIVSEFIHTLESYAEYSISGKGVHIICEGSLPPGGRRKGDVEMYDTGRFFTMSGNIAYPEYTEVKSCASSLSYLHAKYIGSPVETAPTENQPTISLDLTEDKILDLASKSKQGQAFNTLYGGQWQGLYTSQSDADLAFCNMLAFWCGRDKSKMDRIFRKSGLMRSKWDQRRGVQTYGERTLDRSIADCQEVFQPGGEMDGYSLSIVKHRRYAMDDTGNADRFVDMFGPVARYSYIDRNWYFYTGKKWDPDNTGSIKLLTEKILENMKVARAFCESEEEEKAFDKHLKYTRNSKGKVNMIKEAEHRLSILPSEFDKAKSAFNTTSGVLNLRDGKLHPHQADTYLSKISPVEYTDKSDCPTWMGFLDDVFGGDKDLIEYIQKSVGYSMSGSTAEQCVFFCYGNGSNGKSTFLETVSSMMGDYAIHIQPETIMIKNSQGANSDVARLKGARFVTTSEPNEGARLNEGLLKQLTGGDTVTARHLYGKEFQFTSEFKLWMATNHKPIIRGRDDGIWRRMHLIPFTIQIPDSKKDKHLKHKLRKELQGIMKWAVDGCLLWQRDGLKMPQAVQDAVAEYKGEMDVVAAFLDECTERGPGEVKSSELYSAYAKWATDNGEYRMSHTKFGKEVSHRYNKRKTMGVYSYDGIRLTKEFEPYNLTMSYLNK